MLLKWLAWVVVLTGMIGEVAAERVYVESYPGSRPRDAAQILQPATAELESLGFRRAGADADAGALSRPARTLRRTEIQAIRGFVDSGHALFNDNEIERAITEIERALALLDAAPVSLITATDLRKLRMKALIVLAQCYKRRGDPRQVTRAMAELLRSFPDFDISTRTHGYEPVTMRESVAKEIAAEGLGRLVVEVDEPQAIVFVNERYAGVGRVELDELYPGRYRVLVRNGAQSGRLHEVEVEPGRPGRLSVQWAFDAALQNDGDRLFLSFTSPSALESEQAGHANRLARRLDADEILTLSIRTIDGRRTVEGQVQSRESSRFLRRGAVAVEPVVPHDRLRALARFLAGDDQAAKLIDRVTMDGALGAEPAPAATVSDRPAPARPLRLWKWVTLTTGLAAAGTGAYLIAVHESEFDDTGARRNDHRDTRTAGIATAAAGGALIALGVIFFVADGGDDEAPDTGRFAIAPWVEDGLGISAAGRF